MAVRALVFDFDGLILDTERPVYESWRWAFAEHGCDLSVDEWASCIGTPEAWDPLDKLAAAAGVVDPAVIERRRAVRDELLFAEAPLPGVLDLLAAARELGLPVAIASSSPRSWVTEHVERLGLGQWFVHTACFREGVAGKPTPDLYLEAVSALGVTASEAIAFEDSAHGVAAAKAAGLWCVAVPHALTAGLDLSAADLLVDSLASVSLPALLDQWSLPARPVGA
ncbi:MAG TPA: HAD-IA family hydrolase [Acidimicrobiales bacterium]|jgi:HAD superfamily hydrolase (TIGR01509 family)|nr:HAD-IA family hydrolase [Acidimicrobiales bacterium]